MTKQGVRAAIILVLIFAGFFSVQKLSRAADHGEVIINEIAWMGTETSYNYEWIELKNNTNQPINLEGWELIALDGSPSISLSGEIAAQDYFLLERSSDQSVPIIPADIIYTGALSNGGESLGLRDSQLNLIDLVDMVAGWVAGDNSTKQTMERLADGSWQTSQESGGSPRADNMAVIPEDTGADQPVDENSTSTDQQVVPEEQARGSSGSNKSISVSLGQVVINEFVSDPTDGEVEWIELYNTSNREIDLTNWIIEEGSGSITALAGKIKGSGQEKFFIVDQPRGNLNNKGDVIKLKDNAGKLINEVVYGNWDDGSLDNNAPLATDPYATARKGDGFNTFNNLNDFSITATPTKGSSNIITVTPDEEELSEAEIANYDFSPDIAITEIFPNPEGSDSSPEVIGSGEFVEIYNRGDREVNLLGWRLGDESKKRYLFKEERFIKAGEHLAVFREESKLALNNDTDSAKLFQPLKDKPLQAISYKGAKESWSYSLGEDDRWYWTEAVTPGKKNQIETINQPPEIDFYFKEIVLAGVPISFDSSDTIDQEGDKLEFSWDFGDGLTNQLPNPTHTYLTPGVYEIKLVVSDGENKTTKKKTIKIVSSVAELGIDDWTYQLVDQADYYNIFINEFLPNPKGNDVDGEWVELFNYGGEPVSLFDWLLDDQEGGSKPYRFGQGVVWPGEYFLINRTDSNIALNNTSDEVRLFNLKGDLIDSVKYQGAKEDFSFTRDNFGEWFWSKTLTPGEENIILQLAERISGNASSKNKFTTETTLERVKDFDKGDLVRVKGVVAVKPGILGSQIFYVVGSSGVQVYSYRKDFPELNVGDYVEISGEISEAYGEKRIKTKTKDDIKVLGHGEEPKPIVIKCDEIKEEMVGSLVKLEGEIVEKKGSSIYLDDGTDEALVYIKTATGINKTNYNEGERLVVVGILGRTNSGFRVLPRGGEDLENISKIEVLGASSNSDEWSLEPRSPKQELLKYFLVIFIAGLVLVAGLVIKKRQKEKTVE